MRHASAKVTSPPSTRAIANMVPTEELVKRDGCIKAIGEASNGQKTTTITITSTISARPTSHTSPLSPRILSARRSNIASRRFVAPLSWENLRWIVRSNTPPTPDTSSSSFPVATANTINPPTEQLLHSAIANAATRRFALPWSSARRRNTTNPNPDAPMSNRTYTYWEAYSSVQLQVTQVCFAKETYLNQTLTTQTVRNAADDALAVALDEKMCKAGSENATWSALPQGRKCEGKEKWIEILVEMHSFCGNGMESNILGQSVKLLCKVADEREGHIDVCDGGKDAKSAVSATAGSQLSQVTSSMLRSTSKVTVTSKALGSLSAVGHQGQPEATMTPRSKCAAKRLSGAPAPTGAPRIEDDGAVGVGEMAGR
jgi:hypothetical protein